MKIVCINNKELDRDSNGKSRLTKMSLTIGKTYDAIFLMQKYNEKIKFPNKTSNVSVFFL